LATNARSLLGAAAFRGGRGDDTTDRPGAGAYHDPRFLGESEAERITHADIVSEILGATIDTMSANHADVRDPMKSFKDFIILTQCQPSSPSA
jgi:hypothetical protein